MPSSATHWLVLVLTRFDMATGDRFAHYSLRNTRSQQAAKERGRVREIFEDSSGCSDSFDVMMAAGV
jgi:hypothetical protein